MFMQVEPLDALSTCERLDTLNLSSTGVRDLGPLRSCKSLRVLELFEANVADLAPLGSLQSLQVWARAVPPLCVASRRVGSARACTTTRAHRAIGRLNCICGGRRFMLSCSVACRWPARGAEVPEEAYAKASLTPHPEPM